MVKRKYDIEVSYDDTGDGIEKSIAIIVKALQEGKLAIPDADPDKQTA